MPNDELVSSDTINNTEKTVVKILAADDSSDNRFLLGAFLKKYNCELFLVEDGQEAVDAFQNNQFDVILMDMQMPVMDGFTATRLIRDLEKEKNIAPTPILALTAYSLPDEIKQCTDAGCDGHISKPIRKNVLIETIESFTNN